MAVLRGAQALGPGECHAASGPGGGIAFAHPTVVALQARLAQCRPRRTPPPTVIITARPKPQGAAPAVANRLPWCLKVLFLILLFLRAIFS